VNGNTDANSATIGSADNNWYGARFESASRFDPTFKDVGAQQIGGAGNNTVVGLFEDDAGILIGIDTTGYANIHLEFDWRTHLAESGDRFVAGYYAGNLLGDAVSVYDSATRTFDLRNAANGGTDALWNWEPQDAGNTGDWIELLRAGPSTNWAHAAFDLSSAKNGIVWLAFWLDNGENDFGKVDNIVLTGAPVVPLPAALPLLMSGLAGLGLLSSRRRRTR
jgi:hypothetical protein